MFRPMGKFTSQKTGFAMIIEYSYLAHACIQSNLELSDANTGSMLGKWSGQRVQWQLSRAVAELSRDPFGSLENML